MAEEATKLRQNIVTGIQTVGQVQVKYRYNSSDHALGPAAGFKNGIATDGGIELAGFRLDDDFLQANPQIASSLVVPILGGGGIALTNSNRSGQLVLSCVRAGTPADSTSAAGAYLESNGAASVKDSNGADVTTVYDPITIAQVQQGQDGGDACGAEILVAFGFNGHNVLLQFHGCTVAQSGILHLAGNNVPGYGVVWNYLNWGVAYKVSTVSFGVVTATGMIDGVSLIPGETGEPSTGTGAGS